MGAALTLRALASFGLVIALLFAFVWILRRGSLRLTGGRARATIAIETAASLGDRRSLVIVNVEGRRLLLGLAPGAVSLLSELAPAAVPPPASIAPPAPAVVEERKP
jgi:flagellar protein FliO/FliZ